MRSSISHPKRDCEGVRSTYHSTNASMRYGGSETNTPVKVSRLTGSSSLELNRTQKRFARKSATPAVR